jgi:hypothetical protein
MSLVFLSQKHHIDSVGLRWIMVTAAQRTPYTNPRLKRFFERIARRHGRKTARVALARKMLTIVYYMLQRNERYRELSQQD